jgi:predicted Zn-dependent peptidase
MAQESPAARAGQIARQVMLYGRTIPNQEVLDRLAALTPDRLTDLASRLFLTGKPTISAIGPIGKLAAPGDILSSLSRAKA